MHTTRCLQVALPVPIRRFFDYLPPQNGNNLPILPGSRVLVPFGRRNMVGLVWKTDIETDIPVKRLKHIQEVLDPTPLLPEAYRKFIDICANYYHAPVGEVAFAGLPTLLREGKALLEDIPTSSLSYQSASYALTHEQTQALAQIETHLGQFKTLLLEGVTGSGKTELYIQAAKSVLQQHKQILVLVPEIALTPQTIFRFKQRFGENVIHYHSRLTPKQRLTSWQSIYENKCQIVVGTRSAIFLPFADLGLIIVDEEHDLSYKQQDSFRYSAKDMAMVRAKLCQCPVILGSATPTLETLHNAQRNKYAWLKLSQRASNTALPQPEILDLRGKKCRGGLSPTLIKKIQTTLDKQKQVMLFLNRRGYAPALMCHACGWLCECKHCDAKYTYHAGLNKLICHHCDRRITPPSQCPECHETQIIPLGKGTERLEYELAELFPDVPLARIDSDTTRAKGRLNTLLEGASKGEFPILIGTQMLAKGHHFPHLHLVALIDVDSGLFSTDFRATERMAQLLIQVSGRAGRTFETGQVIIQTHHPEHPLIELAATQDYTAMSAWLDKERQSASLPPYSYLGLFRGNATSKDKAYEVLESLSHALSPFNKKLAILGPVPAPMCKKQGRYHFQLLLQAKQRNTLHQALSFATQFLESSPNAKRIRWSCDVDPLEMF